MIIFFFFSVKFLILIPNYYLIEFRKRIHWTSLKRALRLFVEFRKGF